MFFTAVMFIWNVLNVYPMKCVSMNNQCKIRTKIIDIIEIYQLSVLK